MKVAVVKLGCRLAYESTCVSGGVLEALSIIEMMNRAGVEVDIYDKINKGDGDPTSSLTHIKDIFTEYDNINKYGYDSLIVFNGNVTYFGGEDRPHETLKYYIIHDFVGKVNYVIGDFNLLFKQIDTMVAGKSWASNYDISRLKIDRTDINYIASGMLVDKIKNDVNSSKSKGTIKINKVKYFPLQLFPFLTVENEEFNENPEVDLIYGGNFRSGKRESDMIKYYFNYPEDIKVKMFGHLTMDNFNQAKISILNKPIIENSEFKYNDYVKKMNEARAVVLIEDPLDKKYYKIASRTYEAIFAGTVTFVDSEIDPLKRIFKNQELRDFLYVSSKSDVENKLRKLQDNEFRRHIVELEREDVKIDIDDICKKFCEVLME